MVGVLLLRFFVYSIVTHTLHRINNMRKKGEMFCLVK